MENYRIVVVFLFAFITNIAFSEEVEAVSYTHLPLPTIYSV